jgi:hypothetical protein
MNIAIVNQNTLIAKLIEIAFENKQHSLINLDIVTYSDGKFDVVIIDDSLYSDDILTKFLNTRIIIVSNWDRVDEFQTINGVWQVIKKPFMPSQLSEIIEKLENETVMTTKKIIPSDMMITVEAKIVKSTLDEEQLTQILDKDTIQEIQCLLENNTVECDDHEENDVTDKIKEDVVMLEKVKDIKKENEKNKKRLLKEIFDKNSTPNNKNDRIVNALLSMKYKKLKKLLKNAEVSIQIKFPKDKK